MPTRRCVGADRVDHTDGLVAGDQRVAKVDGAVELTAVLLDVGATDATRFDPEQCVVTPDRWSREFGELDRARPGLDCSDDVLGHPAKLHRCTPWSISASARTASRCCG